MTTIQVLRVIGVALATYLFVRTMGMPWGLLAGLSVALLFLP
jgi:hypothetical protein